MTKTKEEYTKSHIHKSPGCWHKGPCTYCITQKWPFSDYLLPYITLYTRLSYTPTHKLYNACSSYHHPSPHALKSARRLAKRQKCSIFKHRSIATSDSSELESTYHNGSVDAELSPGCRLTDIRWNSDINLQSGSSPAAVFKPRMFVTANGAGMKPPAGENIFDDRSRCCMHNILHYRILRSASTPTCYHAKFSRCASTGLGVSTGNPKTPLE